MNTALAWAVRVRNSLIKNGFLSAQIAFGKNCNFPKNKQ